MHMYVCTCTYAHVRMHMCENLKEEPQDVLLPKLLPALKGRRSRRSDLGLSRPELLTERERRTHKAHSCVGRSFARIVNVFRYTGLRLATLNTNQHPVAFHRHIFPRRKQEPSTAPRKQEQSRASLGTEHMHVLSASMMGEWRTTRDGWSCIEPVSPIGDLPLSGREEDHCTLEKDVPYRSRTKAACCRTLHSARFWR